MTTTTTKSPTTAVTKSSDRIYNFSAGPAVLPEPVLKQAQQDIWNIAGSGIGIMEHSHRGKVFDAVINEAIADCRRIANISDDYEILFLQGGATTQFAMIPMSFLSPGATADYPDTGVWTTKAIKEAKLFGTVNVAFEGSKTGYDHTPLDDEINRTAGAAYMHYCSNNTIYGTQYPQPPKSEAPLVCDASSEIFSRPIDINRHAMIYAGAQKNLGPAGVTLIIMRKDFIAKAKTGLPTMFSYGKLAEKNSLLNTPPTFGIYLMGHVFKWILKHGGLTGLEMRNDEKAKIIYDVIDGSGGFYRPVSQKLCRSRMNITFRTPTDELDAKFLQESASHDMSGLKGHRNVGGLRASVYNAFPTNGCTALAHFMTDFATRNG